jgi:CRISPR-associated protein Cas2
MNAREKRYVIVYDVTSDARRTRLAARLLDFGDRVQKSVFEITATPEEFATLLRRIGPLVGPGDSLRAYGLCANCCKPAFSVGANPPPVAKIIVV